MKTTLDIATWNRREHFAFFMGMDEPFHGLIVNVDCTAAYAACKRQGHSFFMTYLHKILSAINATPALRLRLQARGDTFEVVRFAAIHASATIARSDHTFGFCEIEFNPDFEPFCKRAKPEIERVKQGTGLGWQNAAQRDDVVHFSILPNVSFTGLTHARQHGTQDSATKITVGKFFVEHGRMKLPLAIFAHHALADGHDVGLFLQTLQALLETPLRIEV